ncbi:DNA polymerase I [Anaerocaecibacter muris]|uniref:DNA polymerase I n=1 Tax=Anaerocaecibacter muris TaxID=2941513 RepID=UPI002040E5DC|nr:DNA polymerase I [Anaerocaecibacter muris]
MEKDSFIVIDANSLVNRAFYAMPGMTTSRGEPIGAVYGFTTMLVKLIDQYKPKYIAAAFDVHAPTFRHKMTPLYKATRKPMPTDLAAQMGTLKKVLAAMHIKTYELEGYEADDIIGTLARRSSVFTYILTGDRDSLQLVNSSTHALLTKKGISEILDVSPETVSDVFGVAADRVVDFKALAGDSSDNIPGVSGVGDKTAVELISTYGSLDEIYSHIDIITGSRHDKLVADKDNAYLSYKLAKIDTDVPLYRFSLDDCKLVYPFPAMLRDVFARLEFKSLLARDDLYAQTNSAPTVVAKPANTITLSDLDELRTFVATAEYDEVAVLFARDGFHFAFGPNDDYFAPITDSLLSAFSVEGCATAIAPVFSRKLIAFDLKSLMHAAAPAVPEHADDVALMAYLLEYRLSPTTATELFALRDECVAQLEDRGMTALYRDIELPLLHVLFGMERRGFAIDRDKLDEIDVKFSELERQNVKRIRELCGRDINLNSPKQLSHLLFEEMGIPYPERHAKSFSTKAEVLQKLSGEYEIVDQILKYRFNSKLKSSFIDGLKKAARRDGSVHTSFNQMATTTGRLSSTDPNLQNIPTRAEEGRMLRSLFIPREKGNVLVDADYSQIELKLVAHFSGDPKMTDAFKNGMDIHVSTAAEVFDVPQSEVTDVMRREAKAVNFGIVYGISNFGLSHNINISQKKADEYIKRYFERFPDVKNYLDGLVEEAKSRGYAVTLYGRRRTIPELNSAKYAERKFGERVAMNTPLQGTAADIIKIAMVRVDNRLKNMKSKLILQVHDELIVDAAADEVDEVIDILKSEMEGAVALSVPLNVVVAVGKNWMECK